MSTHNYERKTHDDDEIDPVEEMIKQTGCLKEHYVVQDCMGENNDWRACQSQVKSFRECMARYALNKPKVERKD